MSAALVLVLTGLFEFTPPTGLGAAVGAGTALPWIGCALEANPALLAQVENDYAAAGMTWPLGLPSVHYNVLDVASRRLASGGRLALLGTAGYSEFTGSIAKAFSVAPGLGLGASVSLYWLSISREHSELTAGLAAGAAYRKGIVDLGAAVQNFNRPALAGGDPLPVRARIGAGLRPVRNLRIAGDAEYSDGTRFRLGSAFELAPGAVLAAGFGTDPLHYTVGLRTGFKGFFLTYCYSLQAQLGAGHMLSLGWEP